MIQCPLCSSKAIPFQSYREKQYYQCTLCRSVFLHPAYYVSAAEEKERYLEHNNDVNDPGYQEFVSPIIESVLNNQQPSDSGLDYGSGTGPVITKLLRDNNYQITTYDPIFDRKKEALTKQYDYIVCCEVVEHFCRPHEEFTGLRNILKPGGRLYIMTFPYVESIDFKSWNYKDDQTHVFFYHAKAFEWIKTNFGFKEVQIKQRLIEFHG
jgi:SAM-dependent methyltransferase